MVDRYLLRRRRWGVIDEFAPRVAMMIDRFLNPDQAPDDDIPAIPQGRRVYAIGDVHGRLDLLDALLAKIDADDAARDPAATTIVFLGDLVDRGPDSKGVIERLRSLAQGARDVRFLLGNHEEVFLAALQEDKTDALAFFCRIGGRETIVSYGISEADYEGMDYPTLKQAFAERVPADHLSFVQRFEDLIEIGDYLFVHAGIRPGYMPDEQRTQDLRWIREPFLDHFGMHSHMIVHGHTISPDVVERHNRIGIDTGAYSTGRLTALGLEGEQRWLLQT
jgi:serine/threonine protein phosphatase 1